MELRNVVGSTTQLQKLPLASSRNDTTMFGEIVTLEPQLIKVSSEASNTRLVVADVTQSIDALPALEVDVDTLQGRPGTFTEKAVEAPEKLTADRRAL